MLVPKVEHELVSRENSLVQTSLEKVKAARRKFAKTKNKINEEWRDFRNLLENTGNSENESPIASSVTEF